jgi:site-specific DNA-methyltransferase (adenine-specific)
MNSNSVEVFDPCDVFDAIDRFEKEHGHAQCAMFDPWYNKGFGGVREDYVPYICSILERLSDIADHTYFWGFPEIVALFVDKLPSKYKLTAWLTWYYKNNPSVIRGWRSAQMACLHLSREGATLYPEHFLNEAQLQKKAEGKLRYMPGPPSVIEAALLVGFVGRKEQTGHPSQKPVAVYAPLIEMVTKEGDLVFDPMCGSGTTGEACRKLNRRAVLSDHNPEYVQMVQERLGKPFQPKLAVGM